MIRTLENRIERIEQSPAFVRKIGGTDPEYEKRRRENLHHLRAAMERHGVVPWSEKYPDLEGLPPADRLRECGRRDIEALFPELSALPWRSMVEEAGRRRKARRGQNRGFTPGLVYDEEKPVSESPSDERSSQAEEDRPDPKPRKRPRASKLAPAPPQENPAAADHLAAYRGTEGSLSPEVALTRILNQKLLDDEYGY